MSDYLPDLRLAHLLADAADRITLSRFGQPDLGIERKGDLTEVSDADLAAERELRAMIARSRPGDQIQGEEYGLSGQGERRWVLDPIDGTANYVRGVPIWATLIALLDENRPVVGLVSAPALERRWWAASGAGSFRGRTMAAGVRNQVSAVSGLSQAFVSYSSLGGWGAIGREKRFLTLLKSAGRTRAFGDFFSYMLLAEGALDVATEPELAVHDLAALIPVITEAGGQVTSIDGGDPLAPDEARGCVSALATNALLHREAAAILAP